MTLKNVSVTLLEMQVERFLNDIIKDVDYASKKPDFPKGINVIDCALGSSPFGYPEVVDQVLKQIQQKTLNNYLENPYGKQLGDNVRQRFNLQDKTDVFFGSGSYGLLASVLSDLMSPEGKTSWLYVEGVGPQFTNISTLCKRARIQYRPISLDLELSYDDKIDFLIKQRKEALPPAIVYLDNPNNPTGDAVGLEKITDLAEATHDKDLLIVDEAYGDSMSDDQSAFNLIEHFDHIIVLRSLSKTVGLASPRIGYMAMSKPIEEVYKNIELVFSIGQPAQAIAEKVMNPSVLAKFLPSVREKTKNVKQVFTKVLLDRNIKVYRSSPTVSILMAQSNGNFFQDLVKVGVDTEDLATFIPTHAKMNSSYVRFRMPESTTIAEEVGNRIDQIKNLKK